MRERLAAASASTQSVGRYEEDPTFPVQPGTDSAAFSINSVSLGIENSFSVYFSLDLDQFLDLLGAGLVRDLVRSNISDLE